jgi:hypothetical protein
LYNTFRTVAISATTMDVQVLTPFWIRLLQRILSPVRGFACICANDVSAFYVWSVSSRLRNKLIHAANGNISSHFFASLPTDFHDHMQYFSTPCTPPVVMHDYLVVAFWCHTSCSWVYTNTIDWSTIAVSQLWSNIHSLVFTVTKSPHGQFVEFFPCHGYRVSQSPLHTGHVTFRCAHTLLSFPNQTQASRPWQYLRTNQ